MAVVGETRVHPASQAEHDALDERVSTSIMTMGGPPAGLMVHIVRPDGDGFVITEVWRTESDMLQFHEAVVVPALAAIGLDAQELAVWPAWGYARP